MKTLIFNGSPRKNGDTVSLIRKVTEGLEGEYKIVNAYYCNISPCIDCRYCRRKPGCAIQDEMQEIYDYIEDCDNVLVASPVYFSELTGKLLDVGSRFQTYFSGKFFRKETPRMKEKRGAVILVGGGAGGSTTKPFETARILFHDINCFDIHPAVSSFQTDTRPAAEDEQALQGVDSIVKFFNRK